MKPMRAMIVLLLPCLIGLTILFYLPLESAPLLAFAGSLILSSLLILLMTELVTVESYQRLLISRGGHLTDTGIQGQRALLLRPFDRAIPVDMRVRTRFCAQVICFTQEGTRVSVDYMLLWRVIRPTDFVMGPGDIPSALESIINTSLRNEVGEMRLQAVFQQRQVLNAKLLHALYNRHEISGWGIQIINLQLGEIKIPTPVLEALMRQITAELARPALLAEGQGLAQQFDQIKQVADGQAWIVEGIKILGDILSGKHQS